MRWILMLLILASCRENPGSKLDYGTFTIGRERLKALSIYTMIERQGYIDISLQYRGILPAPADDQALRQNIARAITEWTGALSSINYPYLKPIVRIGCCGSHTVVIDTSVSRSYAIPEQKAIYLSSQYLNSYDPNSYRVILHEMGHLVGLADTYSEPGIQQPINQPQSVMNYVYIHNNLQPDDIAGAIALYDYMNNGAQFCRGIYDVGGAYENRNQIAFCVPK